MVKTQPQVCVFPYPVTGWKLNHMSNIISRTLQNNAAMPVHGNPQPQVCLCVSTVNPLLDWKTQITCWCALQDNATVGSFQPQVCAPTHLSMDRNAQL